MSKWLSFFKKENKKEIKKPDTYNFNQVNNKIQTYVEKLRKDYNFLDIKDLKSFKHYVNQESYHFSVEVSVINLDEKYMEERFQTKTLKFPIGFDIDVKSATSQYIDYILNEIFTKCIAYCDSIKNDYSSYNKNKNNSTMESTKKNNNNVAVV